MRDSERDGLDRTRALVPFSLLVGSDNVLEALFRVRALELLLFNRQLRTTGLTRDALMLLVEDAAGLLPRNRVWQLLVSIPLLEERDGQYRLRKRIALRDFHPAASPPLPRSLADESWSIMDLAPLLRSCGDGSLDRSSPGEGVGPGIPLVCMDSGREVRSATRTSAISAASRVLGVQAKD